MVIIPKLARSARTYPEIVLEVTSSNDPVDLVAGEYDAGVQLGEFIQRDMIAVRVTKEMGLAVVGSPAYFKSNTVPRRPRDLKEHSCIGFRFSNRLYRWEFEKGRKALTVSPQGPASFDDPDLVIRAVLDGVGIGTAMEDTLTDLIARRAPGSGPQRLVPFISRIFSLLSQPPESTCCSCCFDRHPSIVGVNT
jgi:DNA-binding transcriptional LysR family regulator